MTSSARWQKKDGSPITDDDLGSLTRALDDMVRSKVLAHVAPLDEADGVFVVLGWNPYIWVDLTRSDDGLRLEITDSAGTPVDLEGHLKDVGYVRFEEK